MTEKARERRIDGEREGERKKTPERGSRLQVGQ